MYQGDSVIGGCRSLTSRTRTTTDSFCDVRRIESRNSGEIDVITDICRNSDFRSLDDVRGKCSNEWTGKSSQHNDQKNQTREADRSWAKPCHVLIVCWLCLRFVCFDISQIRIGFDVESNLYQWIVMIVHNEGVVYKDSELQMKEPYLMLPSNRISIHKFMKILSLLDRVHRPCSIFCFEICFDFETPWKVLRHSWNCKRNKWCVCGLKPRYTLTKPSSFRATILQV